jgi:DNA-nicking Smr family endonuclease
MSPRRPRGPLTDADRALWEHVIRDVLPLRGPKRRRKAEGDSADGAPNAVAAPDTAAAPGEEVRIAKPSKAEKPAKVPARSPAKPAAPPLVKSAPPLAPIERRTKLRLVRGVVEIDARIDLHGLTRHEAHDRLARFLIQAQLHGNRIVLVITGKGAPAGWGHERGVLRREVPLWLESSELRPLVVGFETAHALHGGEGALYVRVRRRRE